MPQRTWASGRWSLWLADGVRISIALVFGVSVVAKAISPQAAELFVAATFGLQQKSGQNLVLGVSLLEVFLAVILVWPGARNLSLWLAAVFFVGASCVLVLAILKDVPGTCGCFGSSMLSATPRGALARNGAFVGLIAITFFLSPRPASGCSRAG